jgi:hypothetical protein
LYYWVNNPLEEVEILSDITATTPIDVSFSLTLQENDQIFIGFKSDQFAFLGIEVGTSNLQVLVNNVEGENVDFEEAFVDFKVTDFVKEIMNRFGLTPFANKFEDKILFLTEEERYLQSEVIDWSHKYLETNSTKYQIGYSRKNNFTFKYADDNQDFNDGAIIVNDVNLKEERTVLSSRTYSVEPRQTVFLNQRIPRPRFWDKEPTDEGDVEYKPLDRRFHFLKQREYTGSFTLESELFADDEVITFSYIAEFTNWRNLIAKYYKATRVIINNTKLSEVLLDLKPSDVKDRKSTRLNSSHLCCCT